MATRIRMVLAVPGEPVRKGKEALAYLTAKTAGINLVFRRRWPVWRKAMAMAQHIEGASLHIFREARGTKNEHSKYWRMLHPQMEAERRPVVGHAGTGLVERVQQTLNAQATLANGNTVAYTIPGNAVNWQAFWQNGEIVLGGR